MLHKTGICHDFIEAQKVDFLFLTETWLSPEDNVPLIQTTPPNFSYFNLPRPEGTGGGLAVFYKNNFKCSPISFGAFKTFEIFSFLINSKNPVLCVLIYRPPKHNSGFIIEFSELLSLITQRYDNIILLGDLNVHVCCPSNSLSSDFIHLTESFDFIQFVTGATHRLGHTLDLVLSLGLALSTVELLDELMVLGVTDHKALVFNAPLPRPPDNHLASIRSRVFNSKSASAFCNAFLSFPSPSPSGQLNNADINVMVDSFNYNCLTILDSIAPYRTRTPKSNPNPWLNEHTRSVKRKRRIAERKWKSTKHPDSLIILKQLMKTYQEAVINAKFKYYSDIITKNSNNPRTLFSVIDSVTKPPITHQLEPSPQKCEELLTFFINKVLNIRLQIPSTTQDTSLPPNIPAPLHLFEPITLSELTKTISQMKRSSCNLDTIPTSLLKEVIETVGPSILTIINHSIISGSVPSSFKHALIHPFLKKPSLDPLLLINYRPISKLSFMSKILEKIISSQLLTHLSNYNLFEKFQSGFRALHSTETALVRVTNDLLMTLDSGDAAILVLLDLSAAFDTVDHATLLSRLESWVGLGGSALQLMSSYLTGRTVSVEIGNATSSPAPLIHGVPQGSILGPLLFSIYMLPLGQIIRKHNIHFHCYADDTQLYLPLNTSNPNCLASLKACLADLQNWMSANFLQLNSNKSEILLFGPLTSRSQLHNCLDSMSANVTPIAKNLGVLLDSDLRLEAQVKTVVRTCFFHIRNIHRIRPILSTPNLHKVVNALISSRLDYCNALYSTLNKGSIYRLQLVQNAATRLITGTRRSEHITPVLAALHWLPVTFRIDFKILLLTFKALNGLAPQYLTDLLDPHIPVRRLRSSGAALLDVPTSRLVTKGDRAFAVRAPTLWNSLPLDIRVANSIGIFKTKLKTHFYRKAFLTS